MEQDEKLYSIGEVAERCGVTLRALRFYEQKHLISPKRAPEHSRLYTALNIKQIEAVVRCKNWGFSLLEVKGMIAKAPDGIARPTKDQIAAQIEHLRRSRDSLEAAIKLLMEVHSFDAPHASQAQPH